MSKRHPHMIREERTVTAMVRIFCSGHHGTRGRALCSERSGFLEYARRRLERCPFQENKTTCGQCPVHCYRPDMREKAKLVMRFSGPRMAWRHPVLALFHALDGLKKGRSKN